MQLKGKQLNNGALTQEKLNVTTDSITDISKVTTKEWSEQNVVNHIETLSYSSSNLDMTALATTNNTGTNLACNSTISDIPQSMVVVRINSVDVNIGGTDAIYAGFFSPDGTVIRAKGTEQTGDKLYWNTDNEIYQLEVTDSVDFEYLICSSVKL